MKIVKLIAYIQKIIFFASVLTKNCIFNLVGETICLFWKYVLNIHIGIFREETFAENNTATQENNFIYLFFVITFEMSTFAPFGTF